MKAPKLPACAGCGLVTQRGTETTTGKCWICFWVRP